MHLINENSITETVVGGGATSDWVTGDATDFSVKQSVCYSL